MFSFGGGKEDASGQTDTTKITGRFKAVIEVEIKTEKVAYAERKYGLVNEMINKLRDLAKFREVEDFDLDLE